MNEEYFMAVNAHVSIVQVGWIGPNNNTVALLSPVTVSGQLISATTTPALVPFSLSSFPSIATSSTSQSVISNYAWRVTVMDSSGSVVVNSANTSVPASLTAAYQNGVPITPYSSEIFPITSYRDVISITSNA